MLAIQPSKTPPKPLTPNLLPCKITHNGPITASKRHWNPQNDVAYLRGRKLRSRVVKLPSKYEGVVLQKTDKLLAQKSQVEEDQDEEKDEEREETIEVKLMERKGTFDEIVVWGHEAVPENEDVYVKGIEEWIGFAEAMHTYNEQPSSTTAS